MNARIYINKQQRPVDLDEIKWDGKDPAVSFRRDSISWTAYDTDGNRFDIHFPNDITLYYGVDRKELQDLLIHELRMNSTSRNHTSACSETNAEYSLVSSLSDTISCRGSYPAKFVVHRYGFVNDTILTDVPAFVKTTRSLQWNKWSAIEDGQVTVLMEHPLMSFEHLLFFRKENDKEKIHWLVDLYSFIPKHNVDDK